MPSRTGTRLHLAFPFTTLCCKMINKLTLYPECSVHSLYLIYMNTLNSTERSDNLFILYCLCLPLLWVKDEETSVWLSTLYNVIIQCFIFIHISVLDLKMIIYTSKSICVNGFLVLKGAQCCYGEDILIRSKTESKEKDAHWLILFLNKQNKKNCLCFHDWLPE